MILTWPSAAEIFWSRVLSFQIIGNFFQSLSCETLYKFEIRVYLVVDWRIYQPKTGTILMWPSVAEIREWWVMSLG
jgi:hypothetical protein